MKKAARALVVGNKGAGVAGEGGELRLRRPNAPATPARVKDHVQGMIIEKDEAREKTNPAQGEFPTK